MVLQDGGGIFYNGSNAADTQIDCKDAKMRLEV